MGNHWKHMHFFIFWLVLSFDIVSEFDQDEICKLIPAVTWHCQTVDLCRALGLSHKMPGLVKVLLSSGRQIEAINLTYAFKSMEQFPPVPLLKAYMREARKLSQVKAGIMSPGAQTEMNELSALKVVIKCIEEQYPIDPLQKRIVQLEKSKADKRAAEAAKPQSKRTHASGCIYVPRITSMLDKASTEHTHRFPYPYDRQYVYAADCHRPTLTGSATYTDNPTHTNYHGNGYQIHYRTAYLH